MMSANKHKLAWSKLRTDIDLISRNKVLPRIITEKSLDLIQKELDIHCDNDSTSLELLNIIYPPPKLTVLDTLNFNELTYREKRLLLGFSVGQKLEKDTPLDRLTKMLKKGSFSSRKSIWQFRLGEACRHYIDWHPFFITLTVDPKKISPEKLWTDGKTWQQYIKSVADVSMIECGLTKKQRKTESVRNYIQYASLIEHGQSGNHHHIHCLMFLKKVPSVWKVDPNASCSSKNSVHRRCLPLESFWKYSAPGLSPAIYFRYIGDVWTRYGHKIPISKGKSLQLVPPQLSGGYLLKYMHKVEDRKF